MKDYFLRRLLLIPITMLGVTLLVFAITRFAPGGPFQRALMEASIASDEGGSGTAAATGGLDEDAIEASEEAYGYDKPTFIAYLQWLGLWRRENDISKGEFFQRSEDTLGSNLVTDPDNEVIIVLKGVGREVFVKKEGNRVVSATYVENGQDISENGWRSRIDTPQDRKERWVRREGEDIALAPAYKPRAVLYQSRFAGVLQGDFGESTSFGDPVLSLIGDRIPVALYFGILTAIITYSVCLPLGIVKAIKHRTFLDNATSILIFVGYSVPGFALGALMVVHLAARSGLFPMFGLDSPELSDMPWWTWERIVDRAHHTVLPLICYVVGSFAFLTMMMKNSLMDNLAADYIRTAVAKGVPYRRAIFNHAFRNSIIPVASTLGQLITILIGGSILIEKVFDIQGFGLLQFQALEGRDTPVIMGTLTIAAFLLVVGNILSDFIVAAIDPRVKFN